MNTSRFLRTFMVTLTIQLTLLVSLNSVILLVTPIMAKAAPNCPPYPDPIYYFIGNSSLLYWFGGGEVKNNQTNPAATIYCISNNYSGGTWRQSNASPSGWTYVGGKKNGYLIHEVPPGGTAGKTVGEQFYALGFISGFRFFAWDIDWCTWEPPQLKLINGELKGVFDKSHKGVKVTNYSTIVYENYFNPELNKDWFRVKGGDPKTAGQMNGGKDIVCGWPGE